MRKSLFVLLSVAALAGCNKKGGAATAGPGGCGGDKVDLTKISGDWVVKDSFQDQGGLYPGDQYRIHFAGPPAADGTLKANLAFRVDSRPYVGKLSQNGLGATIDLLEDMTPDTIDQLKKANNQDPHLPMRSVVHVSPGDEACTLDVTDDYQSYVGDKVVENSQLGLLHMVPAESGKVYSFVRCEGQKGVWFNGKAQDDNGQPLKLATHTPIPITAEAARDVFPKDAACTAFDADVYVDGVRTAEKIPGKADDKSVSYQGTVSLQASMPFHSVELHAFAECGAERKFVVSACNLARQ